MDGTPADEAGILAGDFITHVDGESVLGLTLDDAVGKMRGPVGAEIIITVVREGEGEPFDVSIIRDTIELQAVRAKTEGDTVVLRVTTFNDKTTPNLTEKLAEEVAALGGMDNVNGFVIDRSVCLMRSWKRAKSFRHVAATQKKAIALTRCRVIWLRANRLWF
jgi:carboxyl-terminal processing protease